MEGHKMIKNWDEIKELACTYATENMSSGMNCSESVFAALIRSGALDVPPEYVAFATGFGGGGGGTGLTCGALSSAILANNIVHGRKPPISPDGRTDLKEKHYKRYNNIVSDFVKVASSGLCRDIINQFPEGYNDDNTRPNCLRICSEAAKIAVDYLQMDVEEAAKRGYDPTVVGIKNWM